MKVMKKENGSLAFYCDGCNQIHEVNELWGFNGDFESPTFAPSVLVNGTIPVSDEEAERILNGEKIKPKNFTCHSFVENGKIRFLDDCTHDLAGHTVDLRDKEDWS